MEKEKLTLNLSKDIVEKAYLLSRFYGYKNTSRLVDYLLSEWLKDKEITVREIKIDE